MYARSDKQIDVHQNTAEGLEVTARMQYTVAPSSSQLSPPHHDPLTRVTTG